MDAPAQRQIFATDATLDAARVILLPVPFDATTSYFRGAAAGPRAIFTASAQVDLFDLDTGRPDAAGIAMLPEPPEIVMANERARQLVDGVRRGQGGATALGEVSQLCATVNSWVERTSEQWLAADRIVGTVGGDHASPLGAMLAHVRRFPALGILHIDAHADLRAAYEGFTYSHASIMHNVLRLSAVRKLVQVGVRDFCDEEYDAIHTSSGRVVTFFDRDLAMERDRGVPFTATLARIVDALPREVYVSFDIDGLDPVLCPHTGTPVPGGLRWNELLALLRAITASGRRIVGFDLSEVAPGPDGDEWDANVGARALYKLCGFALLNR